VREHAREIATVRSQQRLEDLPVLLTELTARDPVRRRLGEAVASVGALRQRRPLVDRHEQERMFANGTAHLDVDAALGEVRVGLAGTRAIVARAKADRFAIGAAREHP
jgi:hypothetical protein